MKAQLIVTVDAEQKRKFKIKCINNKTNMTDVIIQLIAKYLKK